ncbi:CHAT domain-containing protein [Archangium gephyra]|nr:CHAT domain-containing protein [Archangium gephyra]
MPWWRSPTRPISAPGSRGGRRLAPVDVPGELEQIRGSLHELHVETLPSGGNATLDKVVSRLHDGHDILYLVCHGVLVKGEPWLWLEDPAGNSARVSGSAFIQRMKELSTRPRLVVLVSCQSAGSGDQTCADDGGVLSALGPRLAEAGVPAVLAMQGNITMQTAARFMSTFFTELQRDGQIDRAVTVARGAVRDRPDWWMPVLFMRLKSGRIWYVPGFGGDPKGFQKWPALLEFIREKHCTPILGSGLVEPLLGSSRDIARNWAETYHFPMAPYESEDLAQVAQFLAVNQARSFPRSRLDYHICRELMARYRELLSDVVEDSGVEELISRAGELLRRNSPAEPHRVLARLPCPIYITTTFDSLLADALREAGKSPRVEFCRWKSELESYPLLQDEEPRYRPDPKNPLVYHLFGRHEIPESLVLTQDDHLDFLIGYTRNRDLVPEAVRRALTMSALLFIGFQLDALDFRVLFRSIISHEGGSRLRDFAHVAAQVDPEEGRILEPEGARRYLESYFLKNAEISIYWGDTSDFMAELLSHWSATS